MLPVQPSWNTMATPILFFATTLLLGSLALGAAFVANYAFVQSKQPDCAETQCDLLKTVLKGISIGAIVLVGVELVVLPLKIGYLSVSSSTSLESVRMMVGPFGAAQTLQLILAFLGAGVFGVFLYITAERDGKVKMMSYLTYGAFALVFAAEVLGRVVFYATHQGLGL